MDLPHSVNWFSDSEFKWSGCCEGE